MPGHPERLLPLTLLALAVVAHAATLRSYPVLFVDEASESSLFWSLAQRRPELNVHWVSQGAAPDWDGGLQGLTLGAAYQLLGVDYGVGRAVSLAWGVLVLAETLALARLTLPSGAAWLPPLVLALSWPFLLSSHLIRPDVVLATLGTGALTLQLLGYRRGWLWPHLLVGPLLALGYQVHQNAVAFALGITLVYLYQHRSGVLRSRQSWCAGAGLLASGAALALPRLLGGGSEALVGSGVQFLLGSTKLPPVLAYSPGEMFIAEAHRYLRLLVASPLELPVLAAVHLRSEPKQRAREMPLLLVLGALAATFLLLVQNKSTYYWILPYPLLCVVFAGTLWTMAHGQRRLAPARLFLALATGWLLLSASWRGIMDLAPQLGYDYDRAMQPLRAAVPRGASVVAIPTYWLALKDHPYLSAWSLSWEHQRSGRPPVALVRELGSQYVILDEDFIGYFEPENPYVGTPLERFYAYDRLHFPLPGRPDDLLGPGAAVVAQLDLAEHGRATLVKTGWP